LPLATASAPVDLVALASRAQQICMCAFWEVLLPSFAVFSWAHAFAAKGATIIVVVTSFFAISGTRRRSDRLD
jgi:hypothetical protein